MKIDIFTQFIQFWCESVNPCNRTSFDNFMHLIEREKKNQSHKKTLTICYAFTKMFVCHMQLMMKWFGNAAITPWCVNCQWTMQPKKWKCIVWRLPEHLLSHTCTAFGPHFYCTKNAISCFLFLLCIASICRGVRCNFWPKICKCIKNTKPRHKKPNDQSMSINLVFVEFYFHYSDTLQLDSIQVQTTTIQQQCE